MIPQPSHQENSLGRAVLVGAMLILIAWSAWQCIPKHRSCFSEAEIKLNRLVASQARLYTTPAAITGEFSTGEQGLRLSPGGVIRYDMAQLDGLLHAEYWAQGPAAAELEIRAEGQGKSTLLLKRRLAPSERALDALSFHYLANTAEFPPGTERILLCVPATSPGAIVWQNIGAIDRDQYPALAEIPMTFVACDAFQPPGLSGSMIMIHAPSRLVFRVPAGQHHLSFDYGFNPATFTDPNANSDGAEISVLLHTPSTIRELMKQLLEPGVRAADREIQTASLELKSSEPGTLELITTAGPNDNNAWDWLVLRNVRIEPAG